MLYCSDFRKFGDSTFAHSLNFKFEISAILKFYCSKYWPSPLSSNHVKFALGLKRPTITLTSVQTRFERQGKFLNSYKVYEYFRKIFLFLSHILIFHWKIFVLWIFMKFMSIFERFFFFLVIDFLYKNFFFYECSWSLWVFLKDFSSFKSYIDFSSLKAWRSVHPLKSCEFFVHVRNESTILTILTFFLFQKSANWHLKLKHFFRSHQVRDFFRINTLLEL